MQMHCVHSFLKATSRCSQDTQKTREHDANTPFTPPAEPSGTKCFAFDPGVSYILLETMTRWQANSSASEQGKTLIADEAAKLFCENIFITVLVSRNMHAFGSVC